MKHANPADTFQALDAVHQQIHVHLNLLAELLQGLDDSGVSDAGRAQASAIEAFFSSTARDHHAIEERSVFPGLLLSDNPEVVQVVHTLKQDHGWIEQNWLELGPMLRAVAQGEDGVDPAELRHAIEVFRTLCLEHIELEERLIYPEAKAQLALDLAARAQRLSAR
ncbi:MAG: hypothetical protein Fur007_05050 [Rhodoferax sp.]